jgi:hypothetical protein
MPAPLNRGLCGKHTVSVLTLLGPCSGECAAVAGRRVAACWALLGFCYDQGCCVVLWGRLGGVFCRIDLVQGMAMRAGPLSVGLV